MVFSNDKIRAPRNRTLYLSEADKNEFNKTLVKLESPITINKLLNTVINQDVYDAIDFLPSKFIDLLFLDPPYNLSKNFDGTKFKELTDNEYNEYMDSWLKKMVRLLKPTASIYICGDWKSSSAIYSVASKYFTVRNRITWEREKGRGAKSNWKNCSEDIWYFTAGNEYDFDCESVKLKRKVLAPYKENGKPKDWESSKDGNFRLTSPSNLWTDISVPFWSMPENTDHPTQKPEKLLAKILLASSKVGDVIFDPFLGSGTTAVVAKKLNRNYVGIDMSLEYCCLAQKRLKIAEIDKTIQGYSDGVFWERNSLSLQPKHEDYIPKEQFFPKKMAK